MPSITTWTRLEPRSRGDDLTPSLEARVHDPAWLLGRQWQLGEYVGEDAGTPVQVQLKVAASPIVASRSGNENQAVQPGVPIESIVGAEGPDTPSLADRALAGAELLALLDAAGCSAEGVTALVGTHLMPSADDHTTSGEGSAMLTLTAGRLPDGDALAATLNEIATSGQVPSALGVPTVDETAVIAAAREWVVWHASHVQVAPASSWVDDHLDHTFTLSVRPQQAPEYALSATSWDGRTLDWYDLEVDRRVTPPTRPADAPPVPHLPGVPTGILEHFGTPTPLTYPGMPAARWWQFEDARINFAKITARPEDLARMLVVEFASVFSNDWYLLPLDLPVGAVHYISEFEVVNTFGVTAKLTPVPVSAGGSNTADWQLFRPTERKQTGDTGVYDSLLLFPSLASPMQSEPFEEVRMFRDEVANLAWAVEATVRGEDGLPLDRHTLAAASGDLPAAREPQGADDGGPLRYQFETDVPIHWFALAPDPNGAPTFRRLVLRRVDEDGQVRSELPKGVFLSPDGFWLWQEEVPREGSRVVRRFRMARGGDGRLYVWRARQANVGRGEGGSGLRYDDAVPNRSGNST